MEIKRFALPGCEQLIIPVQALQLESFDPCWSDNQVLHYLQSLQAATFVMLDHQAGEGCLVGYAFFQLQFECAELLQIAVQPSYQKQGYAAQLIEFSVEQLSSQSITRIQLEVRDSNLAAIKLYQSLGFELDGIRKNYYPPSIGKQQRENAQLFSKEYDNA